MSNTVVVVGRNQVPLDGDKDGRLFCVARNEEPLHYHMSEGNAYHLLAEVDLADGTRTPIFWLRNDDAALDQGKRRLLVMGRVVISANANIHVEIFLDETYTSGGTDRTPINLNRGKSTDTADVTVKDGSGTALVLDTANQIEVQSLFVGAYAPFQELLLFGLPKDKAISFKAQGATGNKIRIEATFWYQQLK